MASPPIPPPPIPTTTCCDARRRRCRSGRSAALTLTWLGFPAGLVTGSLLAVALAALAGRPVMVPVPLSRLISVLVGISLGAVVSPDTLKGLVGFPA